MNTEAKISPPCPADRPLTEQLSEDEIAQCRGLAPLKLPKLDINVSRGMANEDFIEDAITMRIASMLLARDYESGPGLEQFELEATYEIHDGMANRFSRTRTRMEQLLERLEMAETRLMVLMARLALAEIDGEGANA